MRKFSFLLILSLLFLASGNKITSASQFDEVNLNIYETQRLTAPRINNNVFSRINQEGEAISDNEYYEESEYFIPEEDTSRNRTEQKLQKFVDNVIINNKLNSYTSKI